MQSFKTLQNAHLLIPYAQNFENIRPRFAWAVRSFLSQKNSQQLFPFAYKANIQLKDDLII